MLCKPAGISGSTAGAAGACCAGFDCCCGVCAGVGVEVVAALATVTEAEAVTGLFCKL